MSISRRPFFVVFVTMFMHLPHSRTKLLPGAGPASVVTCAPRGEAENVLRFGLVRLLRS